MSDEPKREPATGRTKSADEIVADAHEERDPDVIDSDPHPLSIAARKQRADAFYLERWGDSRNSGNRSVMTNTYFPLRRGVPINLWTRALAPMLAVLLITGCAKTNATLGVDPKNQHIVQANVDSIRFLWGTDAAITRSLDGTLSANIGSRPDSTASDVLAIARLLAAGQVAPAIVRPPQPVETDIPDPPDNSEFQGRTSLEAMPAPPPGYRWQLQPLPSQRAVRRAIPRMFEVSLPVETGGLW
jgi:hypothetical protein